MAGLWRIQVERELMRCQRIDLGDCFYLFTCVPLSGYAGPTVKYAEIRPYHLIAAVIELIGEYLMKVQ